MPERDLGARASSLSLTSSTASARAPTSAPPGGALVPSGASTPSSSPPPPSSRRRVDWQVILGPNRVRPASQPEQGAPSATLEALRELHATTDFDELTRRAVELVRQQLGVRRAGLFLLDPTTDSMLGTWGTDLEGNTTDERHVMYDLGPSDRDVFERTEASGEAFVVLDGCPIVEQRGSDTHVVGRGWVACTPIRAAHRTLGMLFNDAGQSGEPVDLQRQEQVALVCSVLGVLLDKSTGAPSPVRVPTPLHSRHPLVLRTQQLLDADPSLGGKQLALDVGLSVSRLVRVFKMETGMSLVDYRNRLRLERFDHFRRSASESQPHLRGEQKSLLASALAAGFGSYAQFQRVFREERGSTPTAYYRERAQS